MRLSGGHQSVSRELYRLLFPFHVLLLGPGNFIGGCNDGISGGTLSNGCRRIFVVLNVWVLLIVFIFLVLLLY